MANAGRRWTMGLVLAAGLIALVAFDHERAQPLICPWLIAFLGILVQGEYLALLGDRVPAIFRRMATGLGVAALTLPIVFGLFESLAAWESIVLMAPAAFVFVMTATWVLSRRVRPIEPSDFEVIALLVYGFAAFVLPLSFLGASTFLPEGVLFTFTVVMSAKFNDMGAYFAGHAWGRRPMIPGVSPGKTLEGSIGGLAIGVAGAIALMSLVPALAERLDWIERIALAIMIAPLAQLGDLLGSAVKRSVGAKDSSRAVPGFGGWIDVMDSLTFIAPLGYVCGRFWLT